MELKSDRLQQPTLKQHRLLESIIDLSFSPTVDALLKKTKIILADMRLLKLDEQLNPPEELLAMLSQKELETFSAFSYNKRKIEWLGGRIAAKEAIRRLKPRSGAPPDPSEISILPDETGRPVLSSGPNALSDATVSISHSHDYAAAMISLEGSCGIDIQKIVPRIKKVREKFTGNEETSLLRDSDPLVALTTIWTAKEAVKKSILFDQPSLFAGITIHSVINQTKTITTLDCTVAAGPVPHQIKCTVYSARIEDYILSWVEGAPHA